MKQELISEQGNICAYCMTKITTENSTIEHYIPRNGKNGDASLSLDYKNLLLVCNNGRGDNTKERHCDVSKGDKLISVNPCKKEDIEKIKYNTRNGEIKSDDKNINDDLNITLNLNNMTLKNNRKTALYEIIERMDKHKKGNWSKAYVEQELANHTKKGEKIPYVGIIIYELKKRLKRCT